MPYSKVDIINQGLGKFSSSRINRIDPPSSSLERHCVGYTQWKESELAKRRWVFATNLALDLPQLSSNEPGAKPYKYSLPNGVLRPLRTSGAEWRQAGRFVFSSQPDLAIPVVYDIPEGQFDPLFVDVLACRVWVECNDFVKQSRSGREDAERAYIEAVAIAAKANAFVIGPEDINNDDTAYAFITGRF